MPPAFRHALFMLLAVGCLAGATGLHGAYPDLSKGRAPLVLDPRVGANVRLGEDPGALPATRRGQAEPHLVRSAFNPDLLLATFQEGRYPDGGAVNCGYSLSRDGGLTWSRGLIPNLTTSSGGRFIRATDPVAGAGPQGELYLQVLTSTRGAFFLIHLRHHPTTLLSELRSASSSRTCRSSRCCRPTRRSSTWPG